MRKYLTISLTHEDWSLVRESAQAVGETYSGLFRRIIRQALAVDRVDAKKVAKYRALCAKDDGFFARRAAVFSAAGRRKA